MNDHPATGGASQPEEQTAFMSTAANEDAGITPARPELVPMDDASIRCMNGHQPRQQYPLEG